MFIFEVKSAKSLISHISISGQYITLWQRENYESELGLLYKNKQNLVEIVKYTEDPRHPIFHSDLELSHDHIHFVLKKPLTIETFREFIDEIIKESELNNRENAYKDFLLEIESIRVKNGDKKLPEQIQKSISNFDRTTPYFPLEECSEAVQAFEKYLHTRKLSKNITQDQLENVLHIYYELIYSIECSNEEVKINIIAIVKKLKQIAQFLSFNSYLTTTLSIKVIETLINSILRDKNQIQEIDALLDRDYFVVNLSSTLTKLKHDLAEIRSVIENSWHKRIFNFIALPTTFIAMSLFGLGLFGASILGISTWITADIIIRNRDWYKFDSYQLLKDLYYKLENRESISLGSLSAVSDFQMLSATFKPVTWAYSREYYGAMLAKQLQDSETLERRLTVNNQ